MACIQLMPKPLSFERARTQLLHTTWLYISFAMDIVIHVTRISVSINIHDNTSKWPTTIKTAAVYAVCVCMCAWTVNKTSKNPWNKTARKKRFNRCSDFVLLITVKKPMLYEYNTRRIDFIHLRAQHTRPKCKATQIRIQREILNWIGDPSKLVYLEILTKIMENVFWLCLSAYFFWILAKK